MSFFPNERSQMRTKDARRKFAGQFDSSVAVRKPGAERGQGLI